MHRTFTIIDAHAHIFPEKIARKATDAIGKFYDIEMECEEGLSSRLLESGKKIGVSRYLVSSAATTPEQVEHINEFIHAETKLHKEFVGFGTLHPYMENAEAEIERILSFGLHGVKFHPDFQKFNIDDEKAVAIYKRLAEVNLPVLFHTGDDRYDFSAPSRLRRVMDKVDGFVAIAAHFGGYRRWGEANEVLDVPNVYFDTSSALFALHKSEAVDMIHRFGANRFMFGADFPMWQHDEEFSRFMSLDLTDSEREQILSKTFIKLFGE